LTRGVGYGYASASGSVAESTRHSCTSGRACEAPATPATWATDPHLEEGSTNINAVDTGGNTTAVLVLWRIRRQLGGHYPPRAGGGGHRGRLQPPDPRESDPLAACRREHLKVVRAFRQPALSMLSQPSVVAQSPSGRVRKHGWCWPPCSRTLASPGRLDSSWGLVGAPMHSSSAECRTAPFLVSWCRCVQAVVHSIPCLFSDRPVAIFLSDGRYSTTPATSVRGRETMQ